VLVAAGLVLEGTVVAVMGAAAAFTVAASRAFRAFLLSNFAVSCIII
jgi:hypothetical protein